MNFKTLSPICITRRVERGATAYLSPVDPCAGESLLYSLLEKYRAYYGKPCSLPFDYDFTLLTPPKAKLITIKAGTDQQTRIKGYLCRFRLKAPEELTELLYESGAGEKGGMGFGMVTVG
jgi:CRISPR-associated endoribonuclease Cas6